MRPGERIPAVRLTQAVDGGGQDNDAEGGEGAQQRTATSEAARVRVTRAVLTAVQQIRKHHETLGKHLLTTLRTGSACSYTPDSRVPIRWRVECPAFSPCFRSQPHEGWKRISEGRPYQAILFGSTVEKEVMCLEHDERLAPLIDQQLKQ